MHHLTIDRLSFQDSTIHRLDARVKLLATIVFTCFVIAQPPTSVSILSCYAVWPFAVLVIAAVPLKFVLKQILLVSPFILVLALSSLLYDRTSVPVAFGPLQWNAPAGLLRCVSILAKFIITMAALISLVASTPFAELLAAMARLRVPRLLVTQLGLLYRYIFLLIEKAQHILRARAGRKLRNLGLKKEIRTAAAMVGTLCLGSLDTAGRVNMAMHARGFDGRFRTLGATRIGGAEVFFAAVLALYLLAMYFLAGVF